MATPANASIRFAAPIFPILILSTCFLFAGAAMQAQSGGYMRALTSHGQVAGESTDPKHMGWIMLREASMPTVAQIASMANETSASASASAAKAVHKPVIIVKDRDGSSLALLGAFTSKQHFPEIDIVLTAPGDQPTTRYKLTDATIISIRASDTDGGTHEPYEQVRINYAKIEIQ